MGKVVEQGCGVGKGVGFEHGCRACLRALSVGREVLSWKKCSVWVRVYDVGKGMRYGQGSRKQRRVWGVGRGFCQL